MEDVFGLAPRVPETANFITCSSPVRAILADFQPEAQKAVRCQRQSGSLVVSTMLGNPAPALCVHLVREVVKSAGATGEKCQRVGLSGMLTSHWG